MATARAALADFSDGLGALAPVYDGFREFSRQLTGNSCGKTTPAAPGRFNAALLRQDFPILQRKINGNPLVWFDNAATTQKPRCVIDRLASFYEGENSNVHRGAHTLARAATDAYESARRAAAEFLNAAGPDEIVFVRGTTEAVNLVASSWGGHFIRDGDEVLVSGLEHHANIVPWQLLCQKIGARLRFFPVDDTGQIDLKSYAACLTPRTRIVAFSQVSNVLGTVTPAAELIRLAHRAGAVALVDGAQAVAHLPVDVRALDADFYAFSGHKLYGPAGIGVLYGKYALLDAMPPWQGGGGMITSVTPEESVYQKPPHRFEAGTAAIADAAALEKALHYVSGIGLKEIADHEHELLGHMTGCLARLSGLRIVGTAAEKAAVVSFCLDGIDSDEIARRLDREGIAVRSGHHCAQPVLRRFGLDKVVRASLGLYNTPEEIDLFIRVLSELKRRGISACTGAILMSESEKGGMT